ncbi:hypothetical protein [Cobetia sp. L2A1]|uniref:hypothetical protein n=1 Tax=Cobetia sp. L2A1 TaxID=2686360 RepID=UPI00131B5628|nr:hypothetical protein [Cobetia sp. L2A1]
MIISYTEMLGKLCKWTFVTTLLYLIILQYNGFLPYIEIDDALIPPLEGYRDLIEWIVSFGMMPLLGALMAFFLSTFFEAHDKIAKAIKLRYLWEKDFIVKPMLDRVGSDLPLNQKRVREIMAGLYYPEVKNIDPHHVHVFWRYALLFWVLFEHLCVVIISLLPIIILTDKSAYLIMSYAIIVFILSAAHWYFVVVKKSKAQARQIPEAIIITYLNKHQVIL